MVLHAESVALALLTGLLAGPASVLLARSHWTARAPRAALVLWQAVGLGGGLGVLTAGLTLAAADLDRHWLPGIVAIASRWRVLGFWGALGIAITGCVGVYLLVASASSAARVQRARRAHRQRLLLISRALPSGAEPSWRDAPVRLLDHPHAVAYGVPGFRPQVVLSSGVLAALSGPELAAVLAHEQAHARGRHDLVIQPFVAWARTFPFLPPARRAVGAVGLLVEMLADDAALARCSRADLRSAIWKLGGQRWGMAGLDGPALGDQLDVRIQRLADDAPPALPVTMKFLIYVAAVLLVLLPPVTLILS